MTKEFKCTLLDQGIGIEFGKEKFLVSYEEKSLPWDDGKKWCGEQGGHLPTIDQLMTMHEHRDEINKMLKESGKEEIGGYCWSNREHSTDPRFTWGVNLYGGRTDCDAKHSIRYVRAVSAFPSEL